MQRQKMNGLVIKQILHNIVSQIAGLLGDAFL